MVKGQDIVVLAALIGGEFSDAAYAALAKRAALSVSETHAAVKRLREASLVDDARKIRRRNAVEFLVHGLRYLFPPQMQAGETMGLPTAYAAPVAVGEFAVAGEIPVWRSDEGTARGRALTPIYPSVPIAAAHDRGLYDSLALIDMLRGGRARERAFAEGKLKELIG